MRIAVAYENGEIFQHFGHTELFKLYDVENGEIIKTELAPTMGSGHGALAGFLADKKVDTLICGGIGGGAKNALSEVGIKLYGGADGNADKAVKDFIAGQLNYNPEVFCAHHNDNEAHNCGDNNCSHNCSH